MLALLNVAIYDATIAAWEAKYAYNRPRPAAFDPALPTALPTPASPSYPSEHAAAAGAAAAVLPTSSRPRPDLRRPGRGGGALAPAGRGDYPSDVDAGLALGRAVGAVVVERARADGSDAPWTGTVPDGPGLWTGTNPAEPLAGTWRTWALASGGQFRPGPPPAHDSAQMATELAELKGTTAPPPTVGQATTRPAGRWARYRPGGLLGAAEHLSGRPSRPEAVRVPAGHEPAARRRAPTRWCSIADYDAAVACWEAKYAYWAARPVQLDPTVTPLFPTPAHPSYPSGHSANWARPRRCWARCSRATPRASRGTRRRWPPRGCGPASTSAATTRSGWRSAGRSARR